MLSAEMPLIGALVLAIALTANFFRAFWRMDLNRRGRAKPTTQVVRTPRRQVIACALSAAMPLLGALILLMMADRSWEASDAPALALICAAVGWTLHTAMDSLMLWGTPRATR